METPEYILVSKSLRDQVLNKAGSLLWSDQLYALRFAPEISREMVDKILEEDRVNNHE